MSRHAYANVKPISEKQLFGEIPQLSAVNSRPERLRDQIELIKEKGYGDGYAAGFENGNKLGMAEGRKTGMMLAEKQAEAERQAEVAKFLEDVESYREEFETLVKDWFAKTELILTEMSMEVVSRILCAEMQTNQQSALSICKEVLNYITHAQNARIMINPSDFALFESHRDELEKQSRNLRSIEIVSDASVPSGVMVETDAGMIDATVQTRLRLIQTEFDNAA
ncbi:MAG TPA: FliH/SctL family protein [Fimbriimonas sp.]|nr:FliH/SctL family protein [Fimbriimonas sp.]